VAVTVKGLLVIVVKYLHGLYMIFPTITRFTKDVLKECYKEFGSCNLFFVNDPTFAPVLIQWWVRGGAVGLGTAL
jgi:hypothetical protein